MRPDRRRFLRGGVVALALPAFAARGAAPPTPIRRLVAVCTPLGLHGPNFVPDGPYLKALGPLRAQATVISGLAHPGVDFGHESLSSWLTAVPRPGRAGFRNTASLDQFAAEHIGLRTRFPSLSLSQEGFGLSWTRTGALVPSDTSPTRLFARLFLEGKPDAVKEEIRRLRDGRSVLDRVAEQAKAARGPLGRDDRDKLDEYLTSVRELERRLAALEVWAARPKPTVDAAAPRDVANPSDTIGKTRLMLDLTHLALMSDSTRLVTVLLGGTSTVPPVPGVTLDHHNLSHHGHDADKLAQLARIETATVGAVADFLTKLDATREAGSTLLERTSVLFGSNLGSGSSHSCKNLPILVAGGGFRHVAHLARRDEPLSNLYVTLLRRLGVEAERFGTSTGALSGLDPVGA